MEVETEKAGVNTTLDIAENNIEQLKTEISYLSKEKAEVVDGLNGVSSPYYFKFTFKKIIWYTLNKHLVFYFAFLDLLFVNIRALDGTFFMI